MGNPQNIFFLTISVVYYIIIAGLALFSLFGVYILVNHGRSRYLSLSSSAIFILWFLGLLLASQTTLHSLLTL